MATDEHMRITECFDIEETDEIEPDELCAEFEGEEVEIDDIDWEDLEGLDENLLETVRVVFVSDDKAVRIVSSVDKKDDDGTTLVCEKCLKRYKRENY